MAAKLAPLPSTRTLQLTPHATPVLCMRQTVTGMQHTKVLSGTVRCQTHTTTTVHHQSSHFDQVTTR
jgi:hypothetical protein